MSFHFVWRVCANKCLFTCQCENVSDWFAIYILKFQKKYSTENAVSLNTKCFAMYTQEKKDEEEEKSYRIKWQIHASLTFK